MNRGADRGLIFRDDVDRRAFIEILQRSCDTYRVEVHGYCLMGNHYHLLLRTPLANLPQFMRHLGGVYTQKFNARHARDGALFRGRYRAPVIDAANYLLAVSRYIHLNPLEAGLTVSADRFAWSSYRDYLGLRHPPQWLHVDTVLGEFGHRRRVARYKAFVEQGNDEALLERYTGEPPAVIGDEAFAASLADDVTYHIEVPRSWALATTPSLNTIIRAVTETFGVDGDVCMQPARARNTAREAAVFLARHAGRMSLTETARAFHFRHYGSVSSACARLEKRLARDEMLARQFAELREMLRTKT